jgi:thiamine pyrophosphokinase
MRSKRRCDVFVCADGGANAARRHRCTPDLIIGDFDSVRASTLKAFRRTAVYRLEDQDSTDLEKALTWCVEDGFRRITVLGATGGRLDHAVGNMSALAKFSRRADVRFVDDDGELLAVGPERKLLLRPGTTISLLPLARCSGVTTRGLQWNLTNEVLELGRRESTSNVVRSRNAVVRVKHGVLLLFVVRPR